MTKRLWFAPLTALVGAVSLVAVSPTAEARGGGFRGGGGGFAIHGGRAGFGGRYGGHLGVQRGYRGHAPWVSQGHRFGEYGRFGRGRGYGNGYGGLTWGAGYYGVPGGYDGGYRAPPEPTYGIPPSPVLPPAIYVIGGKGGAASRGQVPVIRKGSAGGSLSAGSGGGGGSSAGLIERGHRMR